MEKTQFGQIFVSKSVLEQLFLFVKRTHFSASLLEVFRMTEQRASLYCRYYREETIEEIQIMDYLQDVQENVARTIDGQQSSVTYINDDIWLNKSRAILLAFLVQGLLCDVLEDFVPRYRAVIEIKLHFLFGELEFSFTHGHDSESTKKSLSSSSLLLIDAISKMLQAKATFRSENERIVVLTFKN